MSTEFLTPARRNARRLAVIGGAFAVAAAVTASVLAFAGTATGYSDETTMRQVPGTDTWIVEDTAEVPIDSDGGPSSMIIEGSGAADDADIVYPEVPIDSASVPSSMIIEGSGAADDADIVYPEVPIDSASVPSSMTIEGSDAPSDSDMLVVGTGGH